MGVLRLSSPRPRSAGVHPIKPPFSAADFIEAHKVFRFEEFLEAHTASGASPKTTDAVLQYCVSIGRLENVRRGLYIHANDEPDRYLLCSRLSRDAVLAYEGALAFHGLVTFGNSLSFLTAN